MKTSERLQRLEGELEYVEAILDGSEAQTREAVVTVVALLVSFLGGKGIVDRDEVIEFLGNSAEKDRAAEDHNGKLVHDLRSWLQAQRDDEAGTLPRHVPVEDLLTPGEIEAVRGRVEAHVAFERDTDTAGDAGKRKSRRAAKPPVH